MSIQFGICQAEGHAVERRQLMDLAQTTVHQAPDGTSVACQGRIGMGFQPFHTHLRSRLDVQPIMDELGNMLTLDGRIDNHVELCELLNLDDSEIADSSIVAAAFRRWGASCFSRLIGDWAIALWSHAERSLYLARDHAGTRTLYFESNNEQILWSTSLETFFARRTARKLDEAYVASYLACQPIGDLTPYVGIRAVTPAHYFVLNERSVSRRTHWHWMVKDRISYATDADYEEHFVSLFRRSVERRTGPGAPILAQLSGGMDSTSIVCMSDRIREDQGTAPGDLLDTISYYDDSEPNWNERPYFSVVEARRRKHGIHLSISAQDRTFGPPDLNVCLTPRLPGIDRYAIERERYFESATASRPYRVILSGIGGDELLGGVPAPLLELADYLISCEPHRLISKALEYCLLDRRPLLHMLGSAAAYSLKTYLGPIAESLETPPWICCRLKQIADDAHSNAPSRGPRLGFAPSRIENGVMWWQVLETLPHLYPAVLSHYEYRYPYFDRELVEYLHRIPRDQLVRPGRRRSLMRRALAGIVPVAVLERRRKASLIRGPLVSLQRSEQAIRAIFEASVVGTMGFLDEKSLKDTLAVIGKGTTSKWWPAIIKAISLEFWLQGQRGILKDIPASSPEANALRRKHGAEGIRTGSAAR